MKLGFYQPHLCLRGTTVALFEYAKYNQSLLSNESVVFYDKNDHRNDKTIIDKFINEEIKIEPIDSATDLDDSLMDNDCAAVHIIKGGSNDNFLPRFTPSLIHIINMRPPSDAHGDVFAYSSEWMSQALSDNKVPFVPYIIDLPDIDGDLRKDLGIPKEGVVLGRTGGLDTWNIPWSSPTISSVLNKRKDLWFVFQNTPEFINHNRVKFIESTGDINKKVQFINTCDGMIHARQEGESFGVACGEFSIKNKPVITYGGSPEQNHLFVLKKSAFVYNDSVELENILLNFHPDPEKRFDEYNIFSPEKVMKKFDEVFIKGI